MKMKSFIEFIKTYKLELIVIAIVYAIIAFLFLK